MDVHRDSSTPIDTPGASGGVDGAPDRSTTPLRSAHAWVFDRAPVGLAVIDDEGSMVEANASLLAMCGRTRDEVVGRRLDLMLEPVQHDAAWQWFSRCLDGSEATLHAETWLRPEGVEPIWASIHVSRVPSDGDGPATLVVAITDIAEQRELHGALEAMRGDMTSVFELSPIGMVRIDGDGRVVGWNSAVERLLGWAESEVAGGVAPIVPDGDLGIHLAYLRRARAGESIDGEPVALVARDGSRVEAHVWARRLGDEGAHPEVVIMLVDVTSQAEADRELRASEHRWRTLVENVSDTVTLVGADGRVRSTSGETKSILGYPTEAWADRSFAEMLHPDDLAALGPVIDRVQHTPGAEAHVETRLRHRDGSWAEVEATAVNLLDDPEVQGVVLTTHNITEQKRAERLVSSQAAILELIARDATLDDVLNAIAVMVEDHDEGVQATVVLIEGDRIRPRARADRGPSNELRAALSRLVIPPDAQAALKGEHGEPIVIHDARNDPRTSALAPVLEADGLRSIWWASVAARSTIKARSGVVAFHPEEHTPSDHARRAAEIACTLVAIALERDSTVTALAHRELHDGLTGLPNRTLLIDRLETGLERARRAGDEVSLLYVDLDRFKRINDSEGLAAGDEVLTIVASHLHAVTRPGDTVARVGADEFVILSDQPGSLSTMLAVADRLTAALLHPVRVGGHDVFVTASMGLAVSTEGIDGTELLRRADAAMDRAKERGRNRVEVYDPAMRASAHDRLTLGSDLRRALERDQLRVVYQPIVDLTSGAVLGAEALLRWHHPTRGDVPPSMFIPVAEESGTITEIGMWVLETALAELAPHLAPSGARPFSLSVNLSPRQLDDPALVPRVQAALNEHGWPADRLCLELTETALTDDLDLALDVLVRLRSTGTRIAVDDFGTGYSSLTHLQRLPIDAIKVDRSFVQSLGDRNGSERSTIARCVLGIAATMGLEAVAEGVETPDQLDALRRLGCRRGQGYLFSVPVPVQALVAAVTTP